MTAAGARGSGSAAEIASPYAWASFAAIAILFDATPVRFGPRTLVLSIVELEHRTG